MPDVPKMIHLFLSDHLLSDYIITGCVYVLVGSPLFMWSLFCTTFTFLQIAEKESLNVLVFRSCMKAEWASCFMAFVTKAADLVFLKGVFQCVLRMNVNYLQYSTNHCVLKSEYWDCMRLVLFNGVVNMVQQLSGEVLLWHIWFPLVYIVISYWWGFRALGPENSPDCLHRKEHASMVHR